MIQRIQSVYLFLGAVASILVNFLSLGIDMDQDPDLVIAGIDLKPVFILSLVITALLLLTIFLYKNRVLQMTLCRVNIFLVIVLMGIAAWMLYGIPQTAIEVPGVGMVFPLFALVFSWLSLRKIGDDEKLVRSMDRLR